MSEREWIDRARKLRLQLAAARRLVYPGQCEWDKDEAHAALRAAEDALRLHLDNKKTLVS